MPKPFKKSRRELRRKKRGLSTGDKAIIGIMFIVAVGIVWAVTQPAQSHTPYTPTATSSLPFTTAPDFTLPVVSSSGLTGNQASLSYFRGKIVLLEFMYSWCVHCQNMVPTLEKIHAQYGSLIMISIAGVDQSSVKDVAQFIVQHGGSWIYVYDKDNTAFPAYRVSSSPVFFLVDGNGSVIKTYDGEQAYETLSAALLGMGASSVMPATGVFTEPRKPRI